jgi:hypothetical protein
MQNINLDLIKNTSVYQIDLLKDINKFININKKGKFNYTIISQFSLKSLDYFINNLESNSLYTIIPLISIHAKEDDPHIILNKQILVSKFSNPLIIF